MTCATSAIILNHKKMVNVLRPLTGWAFLSSSSTSRSLYYKHQQLTQQPVTIIRKKKVTLFAIV